MEHISDVEHCEETIPRLILFYYNYYTYPTQSTPLGRKENEYLGSIEVTGNRGRGTKQDVEKLCT